MLKNQFHLHNKKVKDTVASCGNQSQDIVLILYLLLSVSHKITVRDWPQILLIHSIAKLMLPSYPLQPFLAWPTQLLAKCA